MTDLERAVGGSVSRETLERLDLYLALLRTWNPKINLVSAATLDIAWVRHVLDSAQIFARTSMEENGRWVDLGSGGGFPGMVVAILAAEIKPDLSITLIESDARKSTFLRTVARQTSVPVQVLTERIEEATPQNGDVVSARALAPLPQLLAYVQRHMADSGTALLSKGENWQRELEAARESWNFNCVSHTSITDPNSVILEIGEITHV